jgi:hypothetical protein
LYFWPKFVGSNQEGRDEHDIEYVYWSREIYWVSGFYCGSMKDGDQFEDLGVDGIILELV